MAQPGPKPTVTAKVKKEILRLLKLGMSLADTLLVVQVSRRSLIRARQQDPEFARGIKSAALAGKAQHLQRIAKGVPRWQSSAWFLERKYGTEFGQRHQHEITGKDGTPLGLGALSDADLEARIAEAEGKVRQALGGKGAAPADVAPLAGPPDAGV